MAELSTVGCGVGSSPAPLLKSEGRRFKTLPRHLGRRASAL